MCCSTDANKQGRPGWRCDYESVEFMDEEKAGQQVSLQPQTLGELTLASTGRSSWRIVIDVGDRHVTEYTEAHATTANFH